jgi:hypothetical protein
MQYPHALTLAEQGIFQATDHKAGIGIMKER